MGTTWRNRFGLIAVAALLSVAGCSAAQPTARIVVLTYPPATSSLDPGAQGSADAMPTATPTAAPTPTPAPTAAATPTPTPTPAPTPTPTPTSRAGTCTGNDANRAWFAEAATRLKFAVYCASLPKGWYLKSASYELPNGGYLEAYYANKTKTVKLIEGNFCDIAPTCAISPAITGASFGDMAATLHDTGASLLVAAKFGSKPAYGMHTTGLTEDETIAIGLALTRVPKS